MQFSQVVIGLALMLAASTAVAERVLPVQFLEGEAARAAIVNDAREPYFDRLQPLDMAAKTGAAVTGTLAEQRAETRRRYQAAVRPFRHEEQEALRATVAALQPLLRDYPRFARQPWRFVKLADHIEGGLPHTRDDVIVLSEKTSKAIFDQRRRLPAEQALLRAGMLLVHEQLHVVQRLEPARFDRLYTATFGFRPRVALALPDDVLRRQALNPDGTACCWLFPRAAGGFLLPALVFAGDEGVQRMPEDFRMRALFVEAAGAGYRFARGADGRVADEDLARVAEYVQAFPLTRDIYHPHEIAADLFAQLVLYDGVARATLREGPRALLEREFARLRPAFRAALAR